MAKWLSKGCNYQDQGCSSKLGHVSGDRCQEMGLPHATCFMVTVRKDLYQIDSWEEGGMSQGMQVAPKLRATSGWWSERKWKPQSHNHRELNSAHNLEEPEVEWSSRATRKEYSTTNTWFQPYEPQRRTGRATVCPNFWPIELWNNKWSYFWGTTSVIYTAAIENRKSSTQPCEEDSL